MIIGCAVNADTSLGAGVEAGCGVLGSLGTHEAAQLAVCKWILSSLTCVVARSSPDVLELEFEPV